MALTVINLLEPNQGTTKEKVAFATSKRPRSVGVFLLSAER